MIFFIQFGGRSVKIKKDEVLKWHGQDEIANPSTWNDCQWNQRHSGAEALTLGGWMKIHCFSCSDTRSYEPGTAILWPSFLMIWKINRAIWVCIIQNSQDGTSSFKSATCSKLRNKLILMRDPRSINVRDWDLLGQCDSEGIFVVRIMQLHPNMVITRHESIVHSCGGRGTWEVNLITLY